MLTFVIESSARIIERFQGVVEMRRFYPVQWRQCNVNGVLVDL